MAVAAKKINKVADHILQRSHKRTLSALHSDSRLVVSEVVRGSAISCSESLHKSGQYWQALLLAAHTSALWVMPLMRRPLMTQ